MKLKTILYSLPAAVLAILVSLPADAQTQKKKPEEPVAAGPDLPDLVIISNETILEFGGCGTGDPLIKGTIALKNNGKARADRLVAAPISAVYFAEALDVKDEDIVPNALQPREIFTTDIEAGRGSEKKGRGFKGKRTAYIVIDPYNKIAESNELNNVIKRDVQLKDCDKQ